jgi:hypothetical protein
MHLLRKAVTDAPFTYHASCSKCPPSAWTHFVTCVTTELENLQNNAVLLMLLAALRIRWSSSSLVFTLCANTIAFI